MPDSPTTRHTPCDTLCNRLHSCGCVLNPSSVLNVCAAWYLLYVPLVALPPSGSVLSNLDHDGELLESLHAPSIHVLAHCPAHADAYGLSPLSLPMCSAAYGFERPSAIQQRAIMPVVAGNDTIAQAQSGTGKTGTFAISILQRLVVEDQACQALVLAPTRELAQQIQKVVAAIGDYMKIKVHACVGGTNAREDMDVRRAEEGMGVGQG